MKFPSKKLVTIPIEMGNLNTEVKVSVVDAHIPLLLGLDGMEKLGISIDLEKRIATTSRTNESFKLLRTTNGHLALPFIKLQSNKTSVEKCLLAEEEVFVMDQCDMEEKLEKVRKIHNILCHPKPEILKKFFYDSSDNSGETLEAVDRVTEECLVCKFKFKKTPTRPKVGLQVSRNFNYCVALDLSG